MSHGLAAFTSPGTWNWVCPVGVKAVTVECWGAGAGGSGTGSFSAGGPGGGGGAYSRSIVTVIPGSNYAVQVGEGGAGSLGSGNSTAGGDSHFVSAGTVMAKGGSATTVSGSVAGLGGAAGSSVGTVTFSGGTGGARGTSASHTGGGGGGGAAGSVEDGKVGTAGTGANTAVALGGAGGRRAATENAGAGGTGGQNVAAIQHGLPGGYVGYVPALSKSGLGGRVAPISSAQCGGGGGGGSVGISPNISNGGKGADGAVIISWDDASLTSAQKAGTFLWSDALVGDTVPMTVTLTRTPQAGDLLVTAVAYRAAITITMTSSGWTSGTSITAGSGASERAFRMFYKIALGGETTVEVGPSNDKFAMAVLQYSTNGRTVSLLAENAQANAQSTSQPTPAVTPGSRGAVLAVAAAGERVSGTFSAQTIGGSTANEATDIDQGSICLTSYYLRLGTGTGTYAGASTNTGSSEGAGGIMMFGFTAGNLVPETVPVKTQTRPRPFAPGQAR